MEFSKLLLAGASRNAILARLSQPDLAHLAKYLVPVTLPLGTNLGTAGHTQRYVIFPVNGLVSREAVTSSGEAVEVGVIGREGLVGIGGILGQGHVAQITRVQVAGEGFRVPLPVVRKLFLSSAGFADLVHQHLYLQLGQVCQTALCNRLHSLQCRMVRWLLTASDRLGSDRMGITQEFLAHLLGSSRSSVTVTAGKLQQAGILEYSRGQITLADRARLQTLSCECYSIVRALYEQVLGTY